MSFVGRLFRGRRKNLLALLEEKKYSSLSVDDLERLEVILGARKYRVSYYIWLAHAWFERSKYDETLRVVDKGLKQDPWNIHLLRRKGYTFRRQGNLLGATMAFKSALAGSPGDIKLAFHLIDASTRAGIPSLLEEAYTHALPSFQDWKLDDQIGYLNFLQKTGDLVEWMRRFEFILSSSGEEPVGDFLSAAIVRFQQHLKLPADAAVLVSAWMLYDRRYRLRLGDVELLVKRILACGDTSLMGRLEKRILEYGSESPLLLFVGSVLFPEVCSVNALDALKRLEPGDLDANLFPFFERELIIRYGKQVTQLPERWRPHFPIYESLWSMQIQQYAFQQVADQIEIRLNELSVNLTDYRETSDYSRRKIEDTDQKIGTLEEKLLFVKAELESSMGAESKLVREEVEKVSKSLREGLKNVESIRTEFKQASEDWHRQLKFVDEKAHDIKSELEDCIGSESKQLKEQVEKISKSLRRSLKNLQNAKAETVDYFHKRMNRTDVILANKGDLKLASPNWQPPKSKGLAGKWPDFLVVGGAKCGSTAIRENLRMHNRIEIPYEETHFFDRNYAFGLDWYRSLFKGSICGEHTALYLYDPVALARIKRWIPDVKIIVSVRNPVDRMISEYKMLLCRNPEKRGITLDEAVKKYPRLLDRGKYVIWFEYLLMHFPREQIHIVSQEQMSEDTKTVIQGILKFIGVKPSRTSYSRYLESQLDFEIDDAARAKWEEYFRPFNERFKDLVDRKFNWE